MTKAPKSALSQARKTKMQQIEARYELFSDSQAGDVAFESALVANPQANADNAHSVVDNVMMTFLSTIGCDDLNDQSRQKIWTLIYDDLFGV